MATPKRFGIAPGTFTQTLRAFPGPYDLASPLNLTDHFIWRTRPDVWLTASSIRGLADGAAVGTWEDASGGLAFTQGTADNKPLYKVNIVNGRPIVRFDGSNDEMRVTLSPNEMIGTFTHIVVGAFASSPPNVNQPFGIALYQTSTNRQSPIGRRDNANSNFLTYWDNANSFKNTAFAPPADGSFHVATVVATSLVTVSQWWDGTNRQSGTALGSQFAHKVSEYILGNATNSASPWFKGDIAECLLWKRLLSTAERQIVERRLGKIYGITVS